MRCYHNFSACMLQWLNFYLPTIDCYHLKKPLSHLVHHILKHFLRLVRNHRKIEIFDFVKISPISKSLKLQYGTNAISGYPTLCPLSLCPPSLCPGHFVPWSLCPRSLCPWSLCPPVTLSPGHFVPGHFVPWSCCPPVTLSLVTLPPVTLSPIFDFWNDMI
jgi:hypothetical protein